MSPQADKVMMREFLSQFKLLENFAIDHRRIENLELLEEAITRGFVKNWVPKNGAASCTYYATAICTPKGRLFRKSIKEK